MSETLQGSNTTHDKHNQIHKFHVSILLIYYQQKSKIIITINTNETGSSKPVTISMTMTMTIAIGDLVSIFFLIDE